MASIERRGSSWVARYRDPHGCQRAKSFGRRVDCERFLIDVESKKLRGEWVDPKHGRVRYREWVDEWLPTTVNLRKTTRARDESLLAKHIIPVFGDMPLAGIKQPDIRAWVAALSASGLSPASVHKTYQIFKKSLEAAVDASLIARNPCQKVTLPKVEREERRFLNPQEIACLAGAIRPRYRSLVLVGGYSGLRIGELAALRRERVNLVKGEIEVAETLIEIKGRLEFSTPKTRASRRRVGLPRSVVEELAKHINDSCDADSDLVFTAPEGGPLRVPAFRRRVWKGAVRAAALEPLRLHDLRHTAVALWIAAGASPKEVAARAGHTSVVTVLNVYGHLYPHRDHELREKLDEVFVDSVSGTEKGQVLNLGDH